MLINPEEYSNSWGGRWTQSSMLVVRKRGIVCEGAEIKARGSIFSMIHLGCKLLPWRCPPKAIADILFLPKELCDDSLHNTRLWKQTNSNLSGSKQPMFYIHHSLARGYALCEILQNPDSWSLWPQKGDLRRIAHWFSKPATGDDTYHFHLHFTGHGKSYGQVQLENTWKDGSQKYLLDSMTVYNTHLQIMFLDFPEFELCDFEEVS